MFTLWTDYLSLPDDRVPCLKQLKINREYWSKREKGSIDMSNMPVISPDPEETPAAAAATALATASDAK
jgi:hypothetical protein